MLNDLRYAVRTLTKAKGFTAVAVLVLALGIGINTALHTVVYSIFFKPLPVRAPHELVYIYWILGTNPRPHGIPATHFEAFRSLTNAFTDVAGHWQAVGRLTAEEVTEITPGETVTANYFDVLGVKPLLGRTFRADEDAPSTELAIVISHELWIRRFSSSPDILGKKVRLHNRSGERQLTVVGVMPPAFRGVANIWSPSQYWVTYAHAHDDRRYTVGPIARLRPGTSVAQARPIVAGAGEQLTAASAERSARYVTLPATSVRMPFDPGASILPMRVSATLAVVVAIVLFIAAANVAGMLVARGIGRGGEMALRLVLGASRGRLVRQLLTESLALATIGGGCGSLVALWLVAIFKTYTPPQYAVDVAMDPQVLAAAALLTAGMGVAVGLLPAVRASRVNLLSALTGSGAGVTQYRPSPLRRWIVIPQVGLSLVLLLTAGFHVRALVTIERQELGYDAANVTVLSTSLRPIPGDDAPIYPLSGDGRAAAVAETRAERSRAFYRQVLAATTVVSATGGVAIASQLPLELANQTDWTAVTQVRLLAGETDGHPTARVHVSPGYFRTMGIRLIEGRDFDDRDSRSSPRVAIVNRSLAQKLWPGRSAVGQIVAARNNFPALSERIEWAEIVGVVNDVSPIVREPGQSAHIYLSLGQEWQPHVSTIVARTPGSSLVTQQLRAAVASADPLSEVDRIQTMEQIAAAILYPRRLAAAILAASGLIGMMLAAFGIHGIIAYSVVQRVREIGIRSTLGANRKDVFRLILGEGVVVLGLGTALGLALTYTALRVTSRFVTTPPVDVVTLILVPVILGGVILLASYVPARRAAGLDPMDALRQL